MEDADPLHVDGGLGLGVGDDRDWGIPGASGSGTGSSGGGIGGTGGDDDEGGISATGGGSGAMGGEDDDMYGDLHLEEDEGQNTPLWGVLDHREEGDGGAVTTNKTRASDSAIATTTATVGGTVGIVNTSATTHAHSTVNNDSSAEDAFDKGAHVGDTQQPSSSSSNSETRKKASNSTSSTTATTTIKMKKTHPGAATESSSPLPTPHQLTDRELHRLRLVQHQQWSQNAVKASAVGKSGINAAMGKNHNDDLDTAGWHYPLPSTLTIILKSNPQPYFS